MIYHVSVPARRRAERADFYEPVLRTFGFARLVERRLTTGLGKKYAKFWLSAQPEMAAVPEVTGNHVCLCAPSTASVKAFHEKALTVAGRDAGAPGFRKASTMVYFSAFILDLDGNKIEAVTFPRDCIGATFRKPYLPRRRDPGRYSRDRSDSRLPPLYSARRLGGRMKAVRSHPARPAHRRI